MDNSKTRDAQIGKLAKIGAAFSVWQSENRCQNEDDGVFLLLVADG